MLPPQTESLWNPINTHSGSKFYELDEFYYDLEDLLWTLTPKDLLLLLQVQLTLPRLPAERKHM